MNSITAYDAILSIIEEVAESNIKFEYIFLHPNDYKRIHNNSIKGRVKRQIKRNSKLRYR